MDSPPSVLIISDEPQSKIIAEIMRELNTCCTADITESGKRALTYLEEKPYDLIISRFTTRDISGAELLEAFRETDPDVPLIFIAEETDEKDIPKALYRGPECMVLPASDIPYTTEQIHHAVISVLDTKRRKEAEERDKIQSSGIISHTPDPTFAIDLEGRVIAWNKAIEDLTGIAAADILGKGDYEYAIPIYGHRRPMIINLVTASDKEVESQYTIFRRTGNVISIEPMSIVFHGQQYVVQANASPIYDSSGTIIGAVESIRDITPLKEAEEALKESEAKFRGIVERSSDLIMFTDTAGMITYVSPSIKKILGYDPDYMHGKTPEEFHLPEDLEQIYTAIGALQQGGKVKGLEIRFRKNDGGYAILEMSGTPIMENGAFHGMQVIGRDITEKKSAEERIFRLLDDQKELLGIINKSPAVVFLWKAEENWPVERVTENVSQFGYSVDDFLSGRVIFSSLIHTDDLERVSSEVEYYSSSQQVDDFVQIYRIYGKDKSVHWIEDFTHIRRDKTGAITHYQGVIIDITDRKEAEEALYLSRTRYRQLFESSPVSLWEEDFSAGKNAFNQLKKAGVTDFRGYFEEHPEEVARFAEMTEILDVNTATLNLLEAKNKEDLFAGLPGTLTDKSMNTFREVLTTLAEGGLRYTGEGSHKTLLGNEISVIVQMVVAPGYEKSLEKIIISLLDITDRKNAEEALAREKANIEYILDSLPGMFYMFYMFDSKGRFVRWNKNLETLTGYSKAEISQMRPLEFIDERYQDTVTEAIQKAFSEGYTDIEAGIVTKDGRKIPFFFSASSKVIGDIPYILGMGLDITKTKEAEQEIRKLASIVHHSKEFVALSDTDGVMMFINRAGAKLIGIRDDDIVGRPVRSIVAEDERWRLQSEILPALRETGSWEGDIRYQNVKTGDLVNVHAMSFIIQDPETGAPLYLANVSLDISDRKKAEAALKEVNKKLNLLGSITRHDILNQVTVAKGYMEMLEMDEVFPPGSQEEEYLNIVSGAIETIERQILFTRDYRDLGEQAPEWYHVGNIITQNYQNKAFQKVLLENDADGLEIYADPLFTKVIYNLFDNAVKHGETITTITFSFVRSGDQVDLICEDDGVGIPDALKEKIFRREYYKHTGLGLFLSREILSITGLSIQETGTEGEGARFVIHIPKELYRFADEEEIVAGFRGVR